jgi:predicted amidophosphoribosyltransferase
VKTGWISLLFPSQCLRCQKRGSDLCSECSRLWRPSLRTRRIGDIPVYSAHLYSDVAQSIILAAKEDRSTAAQSFLAESIWFLLKSTLTPNQFLTITLLPIPSRPKANRMRGFRHTEELCRKIQRLNRREGYFDFITIANLLFTKRNIKDQSKLTLSMRRSNLDGSMSVRTNARINRGAICVIDDLVTSGSTIHEAERALKRAGFRPTAAYVACSSR